jgi:PAS domain S-box-containing protein
MAAFVEGKTDLDPTLTAPKKVAGRGPGLRFLLIFIALAAGLIAVGSVFFRHFERRFRAGVELQLATIAQLKVDQLVDWRKEKLGDASVFYKNTLFSGLVRKLFENPGDASTRSPLESWLGRVRSAYGYDRIYLLDAKAVERLSVPDVPEPVAAHLAAQMPDLLRSRRVTFLDFHRAAPDRPIHLSLLVPIFLGDADEQAIGILVFRIDPQAYLYPFIGYWPSPSPSGETLIVRREGNEVVFLNDLRFREHTALNMRFPLTNSLLPAARAVRGFEGIMDGVDYRGVAVVAATRAVPDSPWFLVARMDSAEVYAPVRERRLILVLFFGALILAAGMGIELIRRRENARFHRQRYEAAKAISASEVRYRRLFEAAKDGILILDADTGKIVDVNPFLVEMLGVAHEEFIGKRIWDLGFFADIVASQENFLELQRKEYVRYENLPLERADGRQLAVEFVSNVYAVDGQKVIQCNIRDITDRRRAEEALALHKRIADIFLIRPGDEMYFEVLQVILDVMKSPYGFFGYVDEAGALVVPAMTAHVWDEREVAGKSIVFPREAWGDSSWSRALKELEPNFSNDVSTKIPDGHLRLTRHISLPLVFQGAAIGLFQVANKETPYTEDDIRQLDAIAKYIAPVLGARLQHQRHEVELQAKNDELIRFTYTISHDLKSPLVTMRTFLGYLEHDARKSDMVVVSKDLDYIRNAVDKMSQLLDELLELSRIGRRVDPPAEVTLQEVAKGALDLVAGRISGRGVKVKITKEPVLLWGDRARLVEVFQNLVDNAVKFMGDERKPRVEIGVEQEGDETVLFVRDNGMGIDPRHQPKLFNLFEKLDSNSEGTGIGLALVRRIIEVHGGRIWVESAGPGQGSTFRFTLAKTRRPPSKKDAA